MIGCADDARAKRGRKPFGYLANASIDVNPAGGQHDADVRMRREKLMQQRGMLKQFMARRRSHIGAPLPIHSHVLGMEDAIEVEI
jgi:hypothetical protein